MSAVPGTRVEGTSGVGRGRCLRATRAFRAGEIIETYPKPLLALPAARASRTTCHYCLRYTSKRGRYASVKLKACTGCDQVMYCGQACQKAHWKTVHRSECTMFQHIKSTVGKEMPTPVRALAQVLVLLKKGDPATVAAFGDNGSLASNIEAFKANEKRWEDIQLQSVGAAMYALPGLTSPTPTAAAAEWAERAMRALCMIHTNSFDRLDPDQGMTGVFLDPRLAMINHSCIPNAFVDFQERTGVLKAQVDIKAGDEIEISYIDFTYPKTLRQECLSMYHFQCRCPRCKDDLDVYEICQMSPAIPLNSISLMPDLDKLRNPAVNRSGVPKGTIDKIYREWLLHKDGIYEVPEEQSLSVWHAVTPLMRACMWAVEPLPMALSAQCTSFVQTGGIYYALPLACFIATECEPYRYVTPFIAWRLKGVMMIVMLMAETARRTASGEMAKVCSHKKLADILASIDQVTICEALLRLIVYQGSVSSSEDSEVLFDAKDRLQDIESLEGREIESALTKKWANDPQDPQGGAFFQNVVLKAVNDLAALATEILELELMYNDHLVRGRG
ncbi:hypothetical protein B0H63DRAFT_31762 [Podospora didyma]|uniref:Suppressor of anucleate metulae protein B n=1 Tax=Podospora didyma TaxID=330526 RepID=A0AAE0U7T9_9PEZI|nr:hypothetical protein B0H63DRAFT_31762 [Podospora didyma]